MYILSKNLALDLVRVTESAALASSKWIGKGDEKAADQAAVNGMRDVLNQIDMQGTVVIGEGERDEAPMLYIGEEVGTGKGPQVDIALDPLEGTTITAVGGQNAIAVIAAAEKGNFLNAPDVYMDKIGVGIEVSNGEISLTKTPTENIRAYAKLRGKRVEDMLVCILERDRHKDLIEEVRSVGCRIMLIRDGDVAGVIATIDQKSGVDMYIGSGGAPEGVLAAAAVQCLGGYFEGRLTFRNEAEKERARKVGITDFDKIYKLEELAKGEIFFAATGVTSGALLPGVKLYGNTGTTSSIVMRASTGTVRHIKTTHNFIRKDWVMNKN